MFKKITYQVFSLVLAIVFFMVTTGFNLYVHWCSCEHVVKTSLLSSPRCKDTHINNCSNGSCELRKEEIHESCGCKSDTIKIKLEDTNFVKTIQNIDIKYFSFLIQVIKTDNQINEKSTFYSKHLYSPDKSPPILPFGKSIIIQLHQSKTPEFSA